MKYSVYKWGYQEAFIAVWMPVGGIPSNKVFILHNTALTARFICQSFWENTVTFLTLCEYRMRQKESEGESQKHGEIKTKTNWNSSSSRRKRRRVTSDGGLPAEEVEGHGGEERRDALLVMQMKGHHLSQSFGELGLHELHASARALHTETRAHTGIKRQ